MATTTPKPTTVAPKTYVPKKTTLPPTTYKPVTKAPVKTYAPSKAPAATTQRPAPTPAYTPKTYTTAPATEIPYGKDQSGGNVANSAGVTAASTGLAGGQIAGIVIGCMLAAAIVAFVAYRKFNKTKEEEMFGNELEDPDSAADYAAM